MSSVIGESVPFEERDQLTLWIMERTWSEQIQLSTREEWKTKIVWTGQREFPSCWTLYKREVMNDVVWISLDMINTISRRGRIAISADKRKALEMVIRNGDKICMILAEKWTHRLWAVRFRMRLFSGDAIVLGDMEKEGNAIAIDRDDREGLIKAIAFCASDDGERREKIPLVSVS